MNNKLLEMVKYAKIPFELNAKPGDHVVILADSNLETEVWQALMIAVREVGLDPVLCLMYPRQEYDNEPPEVVRAAMRTSNIFVQTFHAGIKHLTDSWVEAQKGGAKCILMEDITSDILTGPAVRVDYRAMYELGNRVKRVWDAGARVHVTSELGTDLVADISGREAWVFAGKMFYAPWFHLHGTAFPDGECGISPVEGTGEGTIVYDGTVQTVGLPKEPLRVTVRDGRMAQMEGGEQANKLWDELQKLGDPNVFNCPAEIAIGLNPGCRLTGNMREDKKGLGRIHIAFGANSELGGHIRSRLHIDGVILRPTVVVDGKFLVQEGKVMV